MVVQSIPPQEDPIQPVAAETAKLVSKYACTVVQGCANHTDDDKKAVGVKQLAAGKKVSYRPVAEHLDIFRRVLLIGQTVHDAHAIVVQAMDKHAQTESVSALILSTTGSRRDVSISRILGSLGRSRDSLRVTSCHTRIVVLTQRFSWMTQEAGTTVSPPGHMLLVQWARKTPEREDGKDQVPEPLPQDKAAVRVVCMLDPAVLRDGGETANKTKSVMRAKSTCWDGACPLLEPKLTSSPPWWLGNVEAS